MIAKKNVDEVFTPRRPDVNEDMYIQRPDLETALIRSISGSKHSFLFGESGNGKSWLYKHVLNKHKIPYRVANGGNVSRIESVADEICNAINGNIEIQKEGYSEKIDARLDAGFAKGGADHQNTYKISVNDPLLAAFEKFSKERRSRIPCVVVIDNLERIYSSDKLMAELIDIIILLDDERYGCHNIKILLVGLPSDVFRCFRQSRNLESVANRLEEIDEVTGFSQMDVRGFCRKGFTQLLKYPEINSMIADAIAFRAYKITLGIAQRVHEYCRHLAYAIEDNRGHYEHKLFQAAEDNFLKESLRKAYELVEGHLNNRATKVARRNQVLYAIGKIDGHRFTTADVERIVEKEFPDTVKDNMGVGPILAGFASHERKLLTRDKKSNTYTVLDPRTIMCIRVMLTVDADGTFRQRMFKIAR